MNATHTIHYFLQLPLVETLGWTLVHFLWEGAAIGVLGWLVLRATYKTASNVRYLIACGLMLACIAAPVATFLILTKPAHGSAALRNSPVQDAPPIGAPVEKKRVANAP